MFRQCSQIKGAVTENSKGLCGRAQKYLVPTGKKAPHLSLLHTVTFTFPAYTIYQSMFFSILFHILSWERNLGSKLCSSHRESTGEVLCTPPITHFQTVPPLWLGSVLLHLTGVGDSFWQPPVLLDGFQKGCSTDIYATRNCAQASDGSLLLKGNCTKIHFPHLQKFFVIVCHVHIGLLCSCCSGRIPNFMLLLRGFTKSLLYFKLRIHSVGPLRGQ